MTAKSGVRRERRSTARRVRGGLFGAAAHDGAGAGTLGERLVSFKRLYRWLNLTLLQHGLWPLLVLLAAAPTVAVRDTPMPWYLIRLGAPAVAAALALAYLGERPVGTAVRSDVGAAFESSRTRSAVVAQARLALFALTIMLALARLAVGPVEPAAKLLLFGAADVAAFQLINFGVVARSYPTAAQGDAAAVLLFGVSWGLRDAMLAAMAAHGSLALGAVSGFVVGLAVGLLSRWLRERLGGFWPAAAAQMLLIYLIAGFAG